MRQIARAGRQIARTAYTWDAHAQKLIAVYNALLEAQAAKRDKAGLSPALPAQARADA